LNKNTLEKLIWSIALPGFGQILNGRYFKGTVFLVLEFLINIQANLNKAIIYSFHDKIQQAIEVTDYQWLMFYPCLYFFSMWDAYKDAGGDKEPLSSLPFVFSAYSVTVGLVYSPTLTICGVLFGTVWLPILFLPIGIFVGTVLKKVLIRIIKIP